jgi:histone acetyltransferase
MLMDHFKSHIRRTYPNMMHFLTYADNYAVGYFEKQGFSMDITLDRSIWAGYIKDYEGGTIMQCTMLRKVDYLDKGDIVAKQQEAIMTKIRQMSKSHIVYSGLPQFQDGAREDVTVDPKDVPGLSKDIPYISHCYDIDRATGESGWTPTMAMK